MATAAPRRASRAAPGTLEHFRRWAADLILDTGDPWEVEPWQLEVVADLLALGPSRVAHLYTEVWTIVPEGCGKTTLWAGVALYHGDTVPNPFVPIAASSREQAEVMYRQAEGFVLRTPGMTERFKCQEGYRRIKCLATVGRIQVYAADDRTADGVIPTLALVDELHRHRDLKLYRTWRGKLVKRGGQIATISTAGEPGSEFEETRAAIMRNSPERRVDGRGGAHVRAESGGLVLHDWAVRDRAACEDMNAVAAANPRVSITAEVLAEKRSSPTMTPAHWQRFVCNIATRESGQAITPEMWDALAEPGLEADRAAWSVGWIDLGWSIDTSAVGILVWEDVDRRVVPAPRIILPPVDEGDVVEAILDFDAEYLPDGWVYDPNAGGRQMAQLLDKGTHPLQVARRHRPLTFIEHAQDNAMMVLAAQRLDEAIRTGQLVHDGDPGLRAHALNTVRREVGAEKWKYDRPPDAKDLRRRNYPIDAFTGLLMGHSVAVTEREQTKRQRWVPL